MVLHTMPSVHYFIAPSWALGVQAELWGLSTGNDTAFRARAEGSALTFSVRKYWWLTDTKIYRRPYAISLLTEALIGGTNLHFLPQGEIQTGQRGQGLQHLYGGLLIGARFQCLPRVYVGINRGIVWSVHEGALRVAPPVGMELALELIW